MRNFHEWFAGLSSSLVADSQDRLAGTHALRPMHGHKKLLGQALTVKVPAGDNLYIHAALRQAQPGDVLVIDGAAHQERALVGEILLYAALRRGVSGFVVDGAVRDVDAFVQAEFPCYGRAITPRGPYKHGPGAVNVPVVIDGCVVHPGDVVLADGDGVVFVPRAQAQEVAAKARSLFEHEQGILDSIAADQYDDGWLDALIAKK